MCKPKSDDVTVSKWVCLLSDLYNRGWTRSLVQKYLIDPDPYLAGLQLRKGTRALYFDRPRRKALDGKCRLYFDLARVKAIEETPEWAQDFKRATQQRQEGANAERKRRALVQRGLL